MSADARRSVSRRYGFRQSSYINFKVEDGYFFCLYFGADEVRLTVKPMYADDLLTMWDYIMCHPKRSHYKLQTRLVWI